MTIITHDDGTGERVHVAYEGPYPWDDGALEKAGRGEDGWKVYRGAARAEYLRGDLLTEWDTATGTFLGKRPVYEPSEAERLASEEQELLSYLASTDWYAVRFAETGEAIPALISIGRQSARDRISEIRRILQAEDQDGLETDVR